MMMQSYGWNLQWPQHSWNNNKYLYLVLVLVAALLRIAGVTAGLAESNGCLLPGLWLTSAVGWLPRTEISSGTLHSVIAFGIPFTCTWVVILCTGVMCCLIALYYRVLALTRDVWLRYSVLVATRRLPTSSRPTRWVSQHFLSCSCCFIHLCRRTRCSFLAADCVFQFLKWFPLLACVYCVIIGMDTVLRRTPASSPYSECAGCRQQGHAGSKTLHQQNPPVLNWRCQLTCIIVVKWVVVVVYHNHAL